MLIVPISPIPDNINEDVLGESLPVLHCNLHNLADNLWLIGIHVDNGGLNSLGDICAIETCPSFGWGCCETDLVICDNMDHSVICVMAQIGHLEALVNNSLASKCSITMNENGHGIATFGTFLIIYTILDGLYVTHDNWIHGL